MPRDSLDKLALIGRVERALVLLAYFIELDGDVHLPMYEKLETELEELRMREATRERARSLLSRHFDRQDEKGTAALPSPSLEAPNHVAAPTN